MIDAMLTVGQAALAIGAAGFGATLAYLVLQLIAWIERRARRR